VRVEILNGVERGAELVVCVARPHRTIAKIRQQPFFQPLDLARRGVERFIGEVLLRLEERRLEPERRIGKVIGRLHPRDHRLREAALASGDGDANRAHDGGRDFPVLRLVERPDATRGDQMDADADSDTDVSILGHNYLPRIKSCGFGGRPVATGAPRTVPRCPCRSDQRGRSRTHRGAVRWWPCVPDSPCPGDTWKDEWI
jgi:hypothetical protein